MRRQLWTFLFFARFDRIKVNVKSFEAICWVARGAATAVSLRNRLFVLLVSYRARAALF